MPLIILIALSVFATWYAVLDAQKRGMNDTGWGRLVMPTAAAGLPIYLIVRTKKV